MAKKKQVSKGKPTGGSKITLIVSDSETPQIPVAAGQRFEVVTVDMYDAEAQRPAPVAARLCGGTSTCLALIDISE